MTLAQQFDAYHLWRNNVTHLIARLQSWLADGDLLDSQADQRLRRIRGRLTEDKLVVAFVAEFSRGKSELINALFFADRGGRVLPSSAGRTTMCPTEISWEKGQLPNIALLPIETRAEGASIAELRGVPEAWQSFPFDAQLPESIAASLRRVGEVKRMPADAAQALGFAVGDGAEGSLVADAEGLVEIPRWRHAMISFPHPLLEQGLVVLDTPGLNAIGAEPELTLSLLPSAHAVLFILAADTGVTQTDLSIWRDHVGNGPARLVVLNKIDGLWDGLRPNSEIDAEIGRQVESCGRILGVPVSSIFPVSAQKGLLAKITGDRALLAKSRLPRLEEALAERLLPAKRDIVAGGTAAEALHLAGEARQLLATRLAAADEQIGELTELRGKNESVVAHTVGRVKGEKETYERGLREYYAVRSVFSQLSETLFSHLGMETLRSHARRARDTMRQARFTPQLVAAMGELFAAARDNLDASERNIVEIADMMHAMHEKFGKAYGVVLDPPPAFSLVARRRQLDELDSGFRRQFGSFLNLLTRDKRTLTQQFFETVASQIRKTFDHANRDAEYWLRALMAPLEGQVREVQRQLKHRLDSVRRIHEAADSLEDRIEELMQEQSLLNARLNELEELEAGLEAALRPPQGKPPTTAA
ncbi:MAG TPA: dynamin family protein [Rhodocyclaceae bacterium]|nr:dynamin family protein [Rhodocyclaceae bacterium]